MPLRIQPMINFRCYKCWELSGYRGSKGYIMCSRCGTKLFMGKMNKAVADSKAKGSAKHVLLYRKLHEELSGNRKIYRGAIQIIVGQKARHRPDAIYYRCGKRNENQPIIYEIETRNSVCTKNAISRCRLFSDTAFYLRSKFYVVVSGDCNEQKERKYIETVLKDNKIDFFEITTI